MNLEDHGCCIVSTSISDTILQALRESLFQESCAGKRCLLDHPIVRETSLALKRELASTGHLSSDSVAIQAIGFDKSSTTNWKVAWHQDLMFPFATFTSGDHFDLPTLKQGIHYARPPEAVLNELLAVRLHLDDCDGANGPLKISAGTHRLGIIRTVEIPDLVASHGEIICLARTGEALLMRPLALHSSSLAAKPKHRRVLHLVYHSGKHMPEKWHRAI